MEKIDQSRKAFESIYDFVKLNKEQILTEADARLQIIDRILIEVLGWPREGILTEPPTASGFLDYLLTSGGRNLFVVEAKRAAVPLVSTKNNRLAFYKVGGAALRDAEEGLTQAQRYCSEKSVPYAALTNGLAWVGFRPVRLDGIAFRDGVAAVFPSLDAVSEKFAEFYDLFSQEGVMRRLYSVLLDREEGGALSNVEQMVSVVSPEQIYLMRKTPLAIDLETIFAEFFSNITGDSDRELLLHCFVETAESHEADRNLDKIARDLVNYIRELRSDTGQELRQEIERSLDTKRGQITIIVGNKGAGKSTFIERFFQVVLDRKIRDRCLILKVPLELSDGSIKDVQSWMTDWLVSAAERELYGNKSPTYDELMGIFFDHYQRWTTGEHKHLYDTDRDQFKINFGEYMAQRRIAKPYDYLIAVLKRAIRQRQLLPCIVFDNADNFPVEFQDAVYQYAYSLYRSALSVVVVPITDRTIWRLSKAGALQSYSAKVFYLPVPSTKSVLEKRVLFIKRKLEDGNTAGEYFSSRGVRVTMANLPAFAACVEEAFIRTDFVSRRVGWLTNYDLRRSLELSQKIITAPILKVDDLVAAYFSKSSLGLNEMRVTQALLYGNYNKFKQEAHDYVLNVFMMESGLLNSPLLRLSVLRLLMDRENVAGDAAGAYMRLEEIDRYFEAMGVATRTTYATVEQLNKYRLIEPYEPGNDSLTPTTRLAITFSGRMHVEMCLNDDVYIEQMAQTTPLRSSKAVYAIRGILQGKAGRAEWGKVRKAFGEYCLAEDAKFMDVPQHASYASQDSLRRDFFTRLCAADSRRF
ncbi:hypothetical protein [Roseomonas mucosa]